MTAIVTWECDFQPLFSVDNGRWNDLKQCIHWDAQMISKNCTMHYMIILTPQHKFTSASLESWKFKDICNLTAITLPCQTSNFNKCIQWPSIRTCFWWKHWCLSTIFSSLLSNRIQTALSSILLLCQCDAVVVGSSLPGFCRTFSVNKTRHCNFLPWKSVWCMWSVVQRGSLKTVVAMITSNLVNNWDTGIWERKWSAEQPLFHPGRKTLLLHWT